MKPQITAVLSSFIIVGLLFVFASCGHSQADIDAAREESYEEGRVVGYEEGYDDGFTDGLYEGLSESENKGNSLAAEYLFLGMLDDAKSYAHEMSDDMRFWEAMDIVSVYLDGYDPDDNPLPSTKEFEEAVDVIFNYSVYLEYNAMELE